MSTSSLEEPFFSSVFCESCQVFSLLSTDIEWLVTGFGNHKCTYASSAQRCVRSDFFEICVVIYYWAVVTAVSCSCFGKNIKLIQHVNFKEKTWENKAKNNTHQNHCLSLSRAASERNRWQWNSPKLPLHLKCSCAWKHTVVIFILLFKCCCSCDSVTYTQPHPDMSNY